MPRPTGTPLSNRACRAARAPRRGKAWLALLALLCAAAVGAGVGAAIARSRLSASRWDGRLLPADAGPTDRPLPRFEVDRSDFDFGRMDVSAKGKHVFRVVNRGAAPLKLTAGTTTCRCTVSEIERPVVPPGESTDVTLTWTMREHLGPFEQTATIETNDPDQPRVALRIYGEVTRTLRVEPAEVVFSTIDADRPAQADVRFYSEAAEPLAIESHELADAATAAHFEIEFMPIPPAEIAPPVRSGQRLHLIVKPGLPPGRFQQTIRVRTNLAEARDVEIPIRGRVAGDLAVAGPGWSEEQGVLHWGAIGGRQGATRSLLLLARGPHRDDVHFRLVEVQPKWLDVRLGATTPLGAAAAQTPLAIEVPPGSPSCNFLGDEDSGCGQIVLETNLPAMPRLVLQLSFAVTDSSTEVGRRQGSD